MDISLKVQTISLTEYQTNVKAKRTWVEVPFREPAHDKKPASTQPVSSMPEKVETSDEYPLYDH